MNRIAVKGYYRDSYEAVSANRRVAVVPAGLRAPHGLTFFKHIAHAWARDLPVALVPKPKQVGVPMTAFVLVHGGWRGGWVWKRVASRLRQEGHDVFTPTMTGLGERSHLLNAGVNLSTNIADIINLIKFEELSNIVLCGHSYGGMIISGVADKISDHISSLFYLDAWLPQNGDSILSLTPEPMQIATIRGAGDLAGYGVPPIPAEVLQVNEKDRAWVDRMCTPHPLATMTEAISLTGNHLKVKKKTFALATAWEPNPFRRFYDQVKGDAEWSSREINSGHDAMLDKPETVSELLLEAASDI